MEHASTLPKKDMAFSWVITFLLFFNLIFSHFFFNISALGYWRMLYEALAFLPILESFIAAIVLAIAYGIADVRLEWPRIKLFTKNLNTLPGDIRYLKIPYYVLLILNLPSIFYVEEQIFRSGTGDWFEIIAKSLGFGFLHYLIGCPLGYAAGIVIMGVWLSVHFMSGGIMESFLHHSLFNVWMGVIWMISWKR